MLTVETRNSLNAVVKELVRDAIGTSQGVLLLEIVGTIEDHLAELDRADSHARFQFQLGGEKFAAVGGNLHEHAGYCWQVFLVVGTTHIPLENHPRYEHLGVSHCLNTPMFIRLMKLVAGMK